MARNPSLEEVLDKVKKYAEKIKVEFNVTAVYLFGSCVKGGFGDDSDIDVAVVSDNFSGDLVEDTFKLMKARRDIEMRIEPHPISTVDFNEKNPFVMELLGKNIKVA